MKISDRSRLPPGQQLSAPGKWPLIGEREPAPGGEPWTLRLSGNVEEALLLSQSDLGALPQTELVTDIHCVTRWSMLDVCVGGVLLATLLENLNLLPGTGFVSFRSRSKHDHSTSLPLEDALNAGTLIATLWNGSPLPSGHGGPLRNIVPGRYFYKSVKWLQEIRFLVSDELGTWERESGYHNRADPWREQRYMAPTLDKRMAATLIESRDFSGHDLRSLVADGRDLGGLQAVAALLRDASFRNANLRAADFTRANLSNAHFQGADLTGVRFEQADLEGANFQGALLSGVDFSTSSLIGASFAPAGPGGNNGASVDAETCFLLTSLDLLAPAEKEFLAGSTAKLV